MDGINDITTKKFTHWSTAYQPYLTFPTTTVHDSKCMPTCLDNESESYINVFTIPVLNNQRN